LCTSGSTFTVNSVPRITALHVVSISSTCPFEEDRYFETCCVGVLNPRGTVQYWPLPHLRRAFSIFPSLYQRAGIAQGYGPDDQGVGVRVPVGVRIFTSTCRPDPRWGPPSFISNGYGG
jgi:hypothetical protein